MTLKSDTPCMHMRVIIFKSTPILKPINLWVFSLLIKIWATITSCLGDFGIFLYNERCHYCITSRPPVSLGPLASYSEYIGTTAAPAGGEQYYHHLYLQLCNSFQTGVETVKGAREINVKGHGMINRVGKHKITSIWNNNIFIFSRSSNCFFFCELRDYLTSSGL